MCRTLNQHLNFHKNYWEHTNVICLISFQVPVSITISARMAFMKLELINSTKDWKNYKILGILKKVNFAKA